MNPRPILRRTFLALSVAVALCASSITALAAPKVVTVDEAAKEIGHHVMFGTGSATPPHFVAPMRNVALARPQPTHVYYMSTFATDENFHPQVTEKWHPNLFFVSQPNRQAATEGRATIHRASLFELGKKLEKDEFPIDTVVVRVSPPDAQGNVSLGTSSDLTMLAVQSVLRRGGKVIAEVNPNVPHVNGNRIPYDSLTHVVHGNDLLAEAAEIAPMEAEKRIAQNVAKLVPANQHHTLQVGIGNALAGVADAFKGHASLDIWSELGPPGLVRLATAPDSKVRQATFSFIHANNADYRSVSNNAKITMSPSTVVNDPDTISKKQNMVAVNTALEVNLLGNVNAERDGQRIISSPGGQPDFMKGAATNPTGKAILALQSAAKNDTLSTVVTELKGPTTTPKEHVDHVVTEWGATPSLRNQPDGTRAFHIITVSHPTFRGQLADEAKKRGLINDQQVAQIRASVLPSIEGAPAEIREHLADEALAKGLITNDQHTKVVVDLLVPNVP